VVRVLYYYCIIKNYAVVILDYDTVCLSWLQMTLEKSLQFCALGTTPSTPHPLSFMRFLSGRLASFYTMQWIGT
jgi:hypothetical protein